jgi:hypothetical protein
MAKNGSNGAKNNNGENEVMAKMARHLWHSSGVSRSSGKKKSIKASGAARQQRSSISASEKLKAAKKSGMLSNRMAAKWRKISKKANEKRREYQSGAGGIWRKAGESGAHGVIGESSA